MKRADITRPEPPPVTRAGAPSLHDVAAALHADRRDHGLGKYGSLLQTFNGRNALVDRVQESLDHLVYEIQSLVEARALELAIVSVRHRLETCAGMATTSQARWSFEKALQVVEDELNPAVLAVRADAIAVELLAEQS